MLWKFGRWVDENWVTFCHVNCFIIPACTVGDTTWFPACSLSFSTLWEKESTHTLNINHVRGEIETTDTICRVCASSMRRRKRNLNHLESVAIRCWWSVVVLEADGKISRGLLEQGVSSWKSTLLPRSTAGLKLNFTQNGSSPLLKCHSKVGANFRLTFNHSHERLG